MRALSEPQAGLITSSGLTHAGGNAASGRTRRHRRRRLGVANAVNDAHLVMVAIPVGSIRGVLREIAAHVSSAAIITDVGSVKGSVVEGARYELGEAFARFVPGHPIAGREHSGVEYADAALFHDKLFMSTPVAQTNAEALERVEALWHEVGCRVERMTPEEHDSVFAAVSHLPHLLAFALVAQIAAQPDAERKFAMAGAGFRDFTRIAASSPGDVERYLHCESHCARSRTSRTPHSARRATACHRRE